MLALRVLFVFILVFTVFTVATNFSSESPANEAGRFLQLLRLGDRNALLQQFGDNACNCQPRGGYGAYLKYESGEKDNMAFLLGKPFVTGEFDVRAVPTKIRFAGGNLPWEKAESAEVSVTLHFDPARYSPLLLPLDMAFGHRMSEKDFDEFVANPDHDFSRQLALRLRPAVTPGLISAPGTDTAREPVYSADYFMRMLPPEETKYLRPRDAAGVALADGALAKAEAVSKKLPRVSSLDLKLLVVRRSQYRPWQVKRGTIRGATLLLHSGKSVDLAVPPD